MDTVQLLCSSPWLLAFVIVLGLVFSFPPALDSAQIKSRPWSEFYGDRLKQALVAGRGLNQAPQHEYQEPPDNVTAEELLGLNPGFTKVELRRAWLRLARELHPDRWHTAGESVRRMKESGLKRVNAARDELLAASN